jgi:ketosteroid isomerase-like protein
MTLPSALEVFTTMTSALDRLDFDGLFGMLSSDVEGYFPYLPDPYPKRSTGRVEFQQVYALASTLFAEFHWTAMETFSTEQDPALVIARASSKGVLHNGDEYKNDYVFFVRVVDGKVAEYREYFNLAPLLSAVATLHS